MKHKIEFNERTSDDEGKKEQDEVVAMEIESVERLFVQSCRSCLRCVVFVLRFRWFLM